MPAGKLFQMREPATANDLAQSAVLVRGTSSIEVPADRMPGRRVPAWRQYSAKYAGAHPVRHLCTSDIQGGPKNGATLFFRNTAQICTIFFAEIKVV